MVKLRKEKKMAKAKTNAFPCLPTLRSISESNISIYIKIIMQFVCTLLYVKVNKSVFNTFLKNTIPVLRTLIKKLVNTIL